MVEYVYKFKSDPTIAESKIKPKSIVDKPDSKADEPPFLDTFYDSLSSFFSSEEEAKRALSPKEKDTKAGEQDVYDAYESAMENRRMREAMGITQSLVEGGGEAYRKKPPEGTITRPVARPDELVSDTAKDVEESAPVTAEAESAGLMSKPLTDDAMGLPDSKVPAPDLAFIKNAGTNQGDNERSVYEYAYEQGLEGDELKSFMSQVAHESRTFSKLEEDGYTRANVNDISTARYKVGDTYKGQPLTAGDPMVGKFKDINRRRMVRDGVTDSNGILQNYSADNVHNSMYADRMGNGDFASGDGSRYKGRGYIQLTGRDNYRLIGEDIGEDLENNPDLMLDPKIAKKASVAWWKRNVQTRQPDYTDVEAVTRIVNGGVNGLTDRRKKFNRYNETVTTPTRTPRPQARN
jgi:hypothetical protein